MMQAGDFLGIGAQKNGSTWLFHQLSGHPQVAFPCGKEFHYWNQVDALDAETWAKLLQPDSRVTRDGRPIRTGEITPAYAVLPKPVIRAIHRRRPPLRLFMSLRNPIERAWSASLTGLYLCGMEVHEASDQWFLDQFLPAGSLALGHYAACLSRRRVVRWFRMQRLLGVETAADMLAREISGFLADASVRITL